MHVNSNIDSYKTMNLEIRPAQAHVQYEETIQDYLDAGRGWVESAIQAL